mmetsp:Transcript_25376/g.76445  ORF Transcript_25376/g.76445 Transcript_25376/m.76445 type:complete len:619 (+) Transcript_25376:774-2630(+)|eukprot:CAMPEP_0206295708 /NCGR_PEP_ID=MMETSP0106_2-20121207/5302_1 /ASSEMBLY_ACC=CAM_ASM_000206 /TAXON_ID=81532 /ORGANISM="Acanthoeca-like sp., Strain 10tr" /LENGTH=618 /DNA_ID=CAMNT_0053726363 /DNA_START=697 /DNA_END=2553 /DNA_ORIENTATION=-
MDRRHDEQLWHRAANTPASHRRRSQPPRYKQQLALIERHRQAMHEAKAHKAVIQDTTAPACVFPGRNLQIPSPHSPGMQSPRGQSAGSSDRPDSPSFGQTRTLAERRGGAMSALLKCDSNDVRRAMLDRGLSPRVSPRGVSPRRGSPRGMSPGAFSPQPASRSPSRSSPTRALLHFLTGMGSPDPVPDPFDGELPKPEPRPLPFDRKLRTRSDPALLRRRPRSSDRGKHRAAQLQGRSPSSPLPNSASKSASPMLSPSFWGFGPSPESRPRSPRIRSRSGGSGGRHRPRPNVQGRGSPPKRFPAADRDTSLDLSDCEHKGESRTRKGDIKSEEATPTLISPTTPPCDANGKEEPRTRQRHWSLTAVFRRKGTAAKLTAGATGTASDGDVLSPPKRLVKRWGSIPVIVESEADTDAVYPWQLASEPKRTAMVERRRLELLEVDLASDSALAAEWMAVLRHRANQTFESQTCVATAEIPTIEPSIDEAQNVPILMLHLGQTCHDGTAVKEEDCGAVSLHNTFMWADADDWLWNTSQRDQSEQSAVAIASAESDDLAQPRTSQPPTAPVAVDPSGFPWHGDMVRMESRRQTLLRLDIDHDPNLLKEWMALVHARNHSDVQV